MNQTWRTEQVARTQRPSPYRSKRLEPSGWNKESLDYNRPHRPVNKKLLGEFSRASDRKWEAQPPPNCSLGTTGSGKNFRNTPTQNNKFFNVLKFFPISRIASEASFPLKPPGPKGILHPLFETGRAGQSAHEVSPALRSEPGSTLRCESLRSGTREAGQ